MCQLRNVVSSGTETRTKKGSTILEVLDVGLVNTFQYSRLDLIDERLHLVFLSKEFHSSRPLPGGPNIILSPPLVTCERSS